MIKPTQNYIVVKIQEETKTKSGVNLTKENRKQEWGKIIHPGVSPYSKGQTVYFKSYSGIPITVDGEEFFFIHLDEVLATS